MDNKFEFNAMRATWWLLVFFLLLSLGSSNTGNGSAHAEGDVNGGTLLEAFTWVGLTWDDDRMLLKFSGVEEGTYDLYELDNPPRIVLDLPGLKAPSEDDEWNEAYDIETLGLVNQLRANYSMERTRVVLETRFQVPWEIISDPSGTDLEILFLMRFRQTLEEKVIDQGTKYYNRRYVTPSGQRFTNVVVSDPNASRLRPRIAFSADVTTRQLSSRGDIVEGARAAVGINGGYFTWPGTSMSMVIQNGEIRAVPHLDRPALMILSDGRYYIDYPVVRGQLSTASGLLWDIDVINREPGPGQSALLTPGHPSRIRENLPTSISMFSGGLVECIHCEDIEDFAGKYILWTRRFYPPISFLNEGERVEIGYELIENQANPVLHALQGGPFLVRNGEVFIISEHDDIGRDIAIGRSARTAVGIDDSNRLYLVTVEGPETDRSIGATLEELAWTLIDVGAKWAINLDGGSSSGMALGYIQPESEPSRGSRQIATSLVLIDESGRLQGGQFFF